MASRIRAKDARLAKGLTQHKENTMRTLVNLTPHHIHVYTSIGVATYPPSGNIARCEETVNVLGYAENLDGLVGVPVLRKEFGDVTGLPDPDDLHAYIVSATVLCSPSVRGRNDVFSPGDPVRDEAGRVVGCRALCVAPEVTNPV